MAGYSGTSLAKKLGIKPGARLLRVNPPVGLDDWLAPLPAGVRDVPVRARAGDAVGTADVILYFTAESGQLETRFSELAARLDPAGGLWIAWPKRASKVPTDLDGNRVRTIGLATGLVDNKVCAISETWSGLRFVYRRKDRP